MKEYKVVCLRPSGDTRWSGSLYLRSELSHVETFRYVILKFKVIESLLFTELIS